MTSYFNPHEYEDIRLELEGKIKHLKEWIWGDTVSSSSVKKWINNFNGNATKDNDIDREQINALHMLSQFMLFTQKEIRILLKSVFRDLYIKPLIQEHRANNPSLKPNDLEVIISKELATTRFLGIGNGSNSSCLLLYYFRQINRLSADNFMDNCSIYKQNKNGEIIGLTDNHRGDKIMNYIFIDDLAGTGNQANSHFKKIRYENIFKYNRLAKVRYFTLFRTDKASTMLSEKHPSIDFKSIFDLDKTYKCFEEESRHYVMKGNDINSNKREKIFAKNICKKYMANKVDEQEICGFLDSQLLLSFFYNTPNNTLPIFWLDSPQKWTPIFRRFIKHIEI